MSGNRHGVLSSQIKDYEWLPVKRKGEKEEVLIFGSGPEVTTPILIILSLLVLAGIVTAGIAIATRNNKN